METTASLIEDEVNGFVICFDADHTLHIIIFDRSYMVNLQAALLRWLLLNSGEVMVVASPRLKTTVCTQLQPLHTTSSRLFAAEVKMLEAAGT